MADQYVPVPGGPAHNNFSNVDLIVEIAQRSKVHAVWVGWGFASENPMLPDKLALLEPKVTFIGPSPSAMRALGDKIASTIVAQSAMVPCVDWSGRGVTLKNINETIMIISDELYKKASVATVEEGRA